MEGESEDGQGKAGVFPDRRANMRYPCRLCLAWRTMEPPLKEGESSIGTLNISSKGLLFSTMEQFEHGCQLEVTLDWPVRLNREIPLKLVIVGNVLRSSGGRTAMSINQYEFRTRGHGCSPFAYGSISLPRLDTPDLRIPWRRRTYPQDR